MNSQVRRIFVEKKKDFAIEAQHLFEDLKHNLLLTSLDGVRIINRYDLEGLTTAEYELAQKRVFAELSVDRVFDKEITFAQDEHAFAVEYLPGQYDQRADSALQCLQILTQKYNFQVKTSKIIVLKGDLIPTEISKVKAYYINPVESREALLTKPQNLDLNYQLPEDIPILHNFIETDQVELEKLHKKLGLAMSEADLSFCQAYFKEEKRNPTLTEIKVIDTYWSDHCRHTTFNTALEEIDFEDGHYTIPIKKAYEKYLAMRSYVYEERVKDITLMDLATIGMKSLRKQGLLGDLDESEEINACSIVVQADLNGQAEEWLIMFKNETHNHPTEIEPFGGAATCLGGAIRDPLSGRSYVYQAMRVTGSGDPRQKIEETLSGKLPQRKITIGAAKGYSSYGNQIGLATGQVAEIYHEGYIAKRMEIGAVIGATPKKNVKREAPAASDVVILVGGKTGRDGCGGATGSSKSHDEESILSCGAEVQKGNPPEERKIQRFFRNPEVSLLIKRCNDFGAGGVSVAIGELADGLVVDLDAVPKKYEGLDGTELAISESQERMAVVIEAKDVEEFINLALEENLSATVVAVVTAEKRLQMKWRGDLIVDLSRDFLNTNGVKETAKLYVKSPAPQASFFEGKVTSQKDLKELWLANLRDLNVCSQKGLVGMFDSSIGAGTVLMPFGGKKQLTPAEAMVAKLPVLQGETKTGTAMSFGFNPDLSQWSPFHGAVYAVVEAVSKIVAVGGDYSKVILTLQEYFEKLGQDKEKWGKPFSALLGAVHAQEQLGIPAIGGKDSMSGTFKELDVPPTLVAFAVGVVEVNKVISNEFKEHDSQVVLVSAKKDEYDLPDFVSLKNAYAQITKLIEEGLVLAANPVKGGGIAEAISKMSFGNNLGFEFTEAWQEEELFSPEYGSLILEVKKENLALIQKALPGSRLLGRTTSKAELKINDINIQLEELLSNWQEPLSNIFTDKGKAAGDKEVPKELWSNKDIRISKNKIAKPKVFIPVFPGTNCEYDVSRCFAKAGGDPEIFVFKNLDAAQINSSLQEMAKKIKESQIIMLPGGFSAGDEPDGSGKFIATVFRNELVADAVMEFLKEKDGLILGICNGFQALVKLGLLPYGEIRDIRDDSPTLTYNDLGRHISSYVKTKVVSNLSPWLNGVEVGDVHSIPVSHGEGKFVANEEILRSLEANGQIATQYVDEDGNPTVLYPANPNGSVAAIEGITSPDGRIFGKMGHSERIGNKVAINIYGEKDQKLFESGINYFK